MRPPGRTAENRNDFRIFRRKIRWFSTYGGVILFQNHRRVRDAAPYEDVCYRNDKLQFKICWISKAARVGGFYDGGYVISDGWLLQMGMVL